ncbi:phospholipase A1-Igamma2, chloroplastic [Fagus crenata]
MLMAATLIPGLPISVISLVHRVGNMAFKDKLTEMKHESDLLGCHNLELYLHLLDGFLGKQSKFRWNARRDVALQNKTSDMLIEELRTLSFV